MKKNLKRYVVQKTLPFMTGVIVNAERLDLFNKLNIFKSLFFRRVLPVGVAGVGILSVASGCSNRTKQEIENLQMQIEQLEQDIQDKDKLISEYEEKQIVSDADKQNLEKANQELTETNNDLNKKLYESELNVSKLQDIVDDLTPYAPDDYFKEEEETSDFTDDTLSYTTLTEDDVIERLFKDSGPGMGTIDRKTAESIFYKDGKLDVDMGNAFLMEYYSEYNGGPAYSDGYVKELVKDGVKYLVDADDICNVLVYGYEKIGEPFYLEYYSEYNGGPDRDKGPGMVQEIIKDGVKYLVDANDYSEVLLCDYEKIGEPFYLEYYSEYNGGPDRGKGPGMVQEIIKDGVKYLVDANDYSQILVVGYDSVYCTSNPGEIVVEYPDGTTNTFYNSTDFVPYTDYVLSRSIKNR